jgi:hypothetical protein
MIMIKIYESDRHKANLHESDRHKANLHESVVDKHLKTVDNQ